MSNLQEKIAKPAESIDELFETAQQSLEFISNFIEFHETSHAYMIGSDSRRDTRTSYRPLRQELMILSPSEFEDKYRDFKNLMNMISESKGLELTRSQSQAVNSFCYTLQQSINLSIDHFFESNSARKKVGNKFEEIIRTILSALGLANKKVTFQIPAKHNITYKCEIDVVISPFEDVRSTSTQLHNDEILVSLKTTTKDRLSKVFIDKLLLERFTGEKIKYVNICLNDIQRKSEGGISYTFLSNLFPVYQEYLIPLDGFYYIDAPQSAAALMEEGSVKEFSGFLSKDVWQFLGY